MTESAICSRSVEERYCLSSKCHQLIGIHATSRNCSYLVDLCPKRRNMPSTAAASPFRHPEGFNSEVSGRYSSIHPRQNPATFFTARLEDRLQLIPDADLEAQSLINPMSSPRTLYVILADSGATR
jgi:hypothetical protein